MLFLKALCALVLTPMAWSYLDQSQHSLWVQNIDYREVVTRTPAFPLHVSDKRVDHEVPPNTFEATYRRLSASTRTLAGDGAAGHPWDGTHSNQDTPGYSVWRDSQSQKLLGSGAYSRFWRPEAVAVHPLVTTIAVADTFNNQIRAISLVTDEVRTIAGSGTAGLQDGIGDSAEFSEPSGLAFSADGTSLYVADADNNCLRKIDFGHSNISVPARAPHQWFLSNVPAASCSKVCEDAGKVCVEQEMAAHVHQVNTVDKMTTVLGGIGLDCRNGDSESDAPTSPLFVDGHCIFSKPSRDKSTISCSVQSAALERRMCWCSELTPLGTSSATATFVPGQQLSDHRVELNLDELQVNDQRPGWVLPSQERFITAEKVPEYRTAVQNTQRMTAGGENSAELYLGTRNAGGFPGTGVIVDHQGHLCPCDGLHFARYCHDWAGQSVKARGWCNIKYGDVQCQGCALSVYTSRYFYELCPKTCSSQDQASAREPRSWNYVSRPSYTFVNSTTVVSRIAGNTSAGSTDSTGTDSALQNVTFNRPMGLSMCPNQMLYIADSRSHKIRMFNTSSRVVKTLAGSGVAGYANGVGTDAMFNTPHAVACSPDNKFIYVADTMNHRIRKISTITQLTSTVAGDGTDFYRDGVGVYPSATQTAGTLDTPTGIAMCPDGNCVLISDHHNRRIRIVDLARAFYANTVGDGLPTTRQNVKEDTFTAEIRTLAGSGQASDRDGVAQSSAFQGPAGLAFMPNGVHFFVCDREGNRIRQVTMASTAPTAPTGPLPYAVSSTSLTISWTGSAAVPLVDKYEIEYRELAGLHGTLNSDRRGPNLAVRSTWKTVTRLAQSGTAIHRPSATLYDLIPNTGYGVRVRAHNYVGWSKWSWETLMTTANCGNVALQWLHADGTVHAIGSDYCKSASPLSHHRWPPDADPALLK